MSIDEIIGLFIVLLLFLFPLLKRLLQRPKAKEAVREAHSEIKESTPQPSPQERMVNSDFEFHSTLDAFKSEDRVSKREMEIHIHPEFKENVVSEAFLQTKKTKKKKVKHTLLSGRNLIIGHEIMSTPKALRDSLWE